MKTSLVLAITVSILVLLFASSLHGQSKGEGFRIYEKAEQLRKNAEFNSDLRKAAEKYEESIRMLEKNGNRKLVCKASEMLGNLYFTLEDNEKAMIWYQKCLWSCSELKDEKRQGRILLGLGAAARRLERCDQAVEYCSQATAIHKKRKDRMSTAAALRELGLAYQTMGKHDPACEAFLEYLTIRRDGFQDRT